MNLSNTKSKSLLLASIILAITFISTIPATNTNILAEEVEKENKQESAPKEIIHIVRPGDSLCRIATKYKVHLWQIRAWNDMNTGTLLHPGQEIVVKEINYDTYEGLASWYGPNFHGKNMANGQVYDMYDIVVAHRTLPLGRKVKITNLDNGKSIIAPVLDRGPYVKNDQGEYTREIDLSYGVALALGTVPKGVVPTRIEPIDETLPLN